MDKLNHVYDTQSPVEVVFDDDDAAESKRPPSARKSGDQPSPTYSVSSLMDGRTAYSAVFDPV